LKFDDAVVGLLRVKPTKDMPRPGAHPAKSHMQKMDEEYGALPLTRRRTKKK